MKTWNVRDQTKETLEILLKRKYKEIDSNYKMLKKVSNIEDAKRLVDEIWQMKSFTNAIEMELIRREYNDGTQKRSGSRRPEALYPDCKAGKEYQCQTEGLTRRYPTVSNKNQRKEVN